MAATTHRWRHLGRPPGSPPRRYRIEEYDRWFPRTQREMLGVLKRCGVGAGAPAPVAPTGAEAATRPGAAAVVVSPWMSTPAPWYSLMLGIGLARRGRSVVFVWDDCGFPQRALDAQQQAIGEVLDVVGASFPVRRLTTGGAAPARPGDAALIDSLTQQILTWTLRGEVPRERDAQTAEEFRQALTRALPLVRSTLGDLGPDVVVVPGGIWGTSGLFVEVAGELGCRASTFDADRGIAQVTATGIAAQCGDVPTAFRTLWDADEAERSRAIDLARAEFAERAKGSDRYGYQVVAADQRPAVDRIAAVLPLNVEWDAGALGLHAVFDDTVDWVTSAVRTVLDADVGTVVVRQHPSERRALQRSRLDLRTVLSEQFGDDPRVRFVTAEDDANTYDLLAATDLVLPFVSTIGIEAAAMGKQVLVAGSSYYADLGFVWSVSSRDEYLTLLRQGLRGKLASQPDQVERAWLCYYLTAVRNRVWTDFNTSPDDFWAWSSRSPDALFAEPEVQDLLETIDLGIPISLVRHRRHFAHAQ